MNNNTMLQLTEQYVRDHGNLLRREGVPEACDRVFVFRQFRFFFTVNGNNSSPADLSDTAGDGVPDFVIRAVHRLAVAQRLFTEGLGLQDFLSGGLLYDQGARYLCIYLGHIPVEHGIASARVQAAASAFFDEDASSVNAIRLMLHRGLHANTLTPVHEMFHLFQFGYSHFNNLWLMEGLARWSQRLFQTAVPRMSSLPATVDQLNRLLNKWHDAEFFWNRLSALCSRGPLQVPACLLEAGLPLNRNWIDGVFVRALLQQLQDMPASMRAEQPDRKLPLKGPWLRLEKRSATNNRYIFRAILRAMEVIQPPDHPELAAFVDLITPLAHGAPDSGFEAPEIQRMMRFLQKFQVSKVRPCRSGFCCDHYDVSSRTLSTASVVLDHSALRNDDLECWRAVSNISGDFTIRNTPLLTGLDGLDNLESLDGNLTLEGMAVASLHGLNRLERVKGSITIIGNPRLSAISGFTSLETVDQQIAISDNPTLARITGFNSLQRIKKGGLHVVNSSQLELITGFSSLMQVKNLAFKSLGITSVAFLEKLMTSQAAFPGFIKIEFCRLADIRPFKPLKSVASSLYLHGNRLENLEGLDNLVSVGGSLSLSSNRLVDISQLSRLKVVRGMLGVAYNQLTTLRGLDNLMSVKTVKWGDQIRTLVLHKNPHLADIAALANVTTEDNYLTVYLDDPRQYLRRPPYPSKFHDNILELHDASNGSLVPTYSFVTKSIHDYRLFRRTTHNKLRVHLVDLETDADTLILSFSGLNGNLGGMFYNRFPLITNTLATHKVFVKDTRHLWYHGGIPGVTKNIEATIALIQGIATARAYRKIVCVGASMGGYMALLTGHIIHATHIVAFSPQTFIDRLNRIRYGDTRWACELKKLPSGIAPHYLDLALLYRNRTNTESNIQIHFGTRVNLDRIHAAHLGEYDNLRAYGYDVDDHSISMYLDRNGRLNPIIEEILETDSIGKE